MTEKDARKELMRRAVDLNPTVHVGKDGLDQGVFEEISTQLKKNRVIKVKVLSNSEDGAIDNILFSFDYSLLDCGMVESGNSDHNMLWALLVLK